MSEMIEKVARALFALDAPNSDPDEPVFHPIKDLQKPKWKLYERQAEAAIEVLSAYNPNERLSRAESLLKQALEAIESARSEPLFIMRDAIRNYLEDHSALSPLPQDDAAELRRAMIEGVHE